MFDRLLKKVADAASKHFGEDPGKIIGPRDEGDGKKMFLHGLMKIHVISASDLPDCDTAFFNIDGKDVTDPYVNVFLGEARLAKTRYMNNDLNPCWDEKFTVDVCHRSASMTFDVKDKDHVGGAFVGSVMIQTEDLMSGEVFETTQDLVDAQGEPIQGSLTFSVQYIPKAALDEAEAGKILHRAYFPARENNRLILYQDAETLPMPQFEGLANPDGSEYVPTRCWKDLFDTIQAAQKFLYITGWSVYTEISLVRGDEESEAASNVGELLKAKAAEGVKVLVMVWNEKLSTDLHDGLMGTHDEDTRRYFEGTDVDCVLVPRQKSDQNSSVLGRVMANEFVSGCYTHHQKTVICDAEDPADGSRRVVAFIGGLDITNGRYDTPEFPLFKTLSTLHATDFLSNCVPGTTVETGPREPWHDCHAKAEGPVAHDIKKNFEERWVKQSENMAQQIFNVFEDGDFGDVEAPAPQEECEGGDWTLQLFRSITSDSANFDIDKSHVLHSKGGKLIQNDIMRSMVHQIRQAKNFIYMENQYFLGSAYTWCEDSSTLTHHIVPQEIAQKICDKIREGEMFRAYICIPMWPEGDPASAPIQEILRWQFRTMQAMYHQIGAAIQEAEAETQPTDYLMFFCLGKRESPDEVPEDLAAPPEGTLVEAVRTSLRHPIYVHSKMTIVDDDYVLVGSANINQRSLGGNRDSEIAVGGFQPDHLATDGVDPRGGVHTYRMALWSAHLGGYSEAYLNPNSEECASAVKEKTQAFWEHYTADEPEHSDVHLLPYPITVDNCGEVTNLDEPWNNFPDTTADVLGQKSGYLPGKLTT